MLDITEITVKAGRGGDGAITFRREKFVPFGGPDGGDGGNGGDVIVQSDSAAMNLWGFRKKGLYRAGEGGEGQRQKKHGKNGEALVLKVPEGTVVYEKNKDGLDDLLGDLGKAGESVSVAKGGKGGLGNVHFASSTNQTPRLAQAGEAGEEKVLVLELKLIADAGIIGYPNVGKSSLLALATAAKPQIADYPFTTREPIIGVVEVEFDSFVLAEIPGLIEGAHLGRGLGHDFLRHSMRTRVLIHLVDGSADLPLDNMIKVNNELSLFDSQLAKKPQVVVINKIDLPAVRERKGEIKAAFREAGISVHFISAATGEGIAELMKTVLGLLKNTKTRTEDPAPKIFRPQPRRRPVIITREDDTFVIDMPELERIVTRVDMTDPTVTGQVRGQMTRLHIDKALENSGIKRGDKIRCGSSEWEW
ncbi:MAG: GTPase ObgE [Dehalococcoidales bacterium]|nr:GTPase ObgE [Dehalococcoidales bacterium]